VIDAQAATSFRNGTSPYTISFSDSPSGMQYTISQSGNPVSTGAFTEGMSLTVGGVSLRVDGAPKAGDQFTVAPSRPQSMFSTLSQLADALRKPQSTAAQHAQNNQRINAVLSNLKQSQTRVESLQSTVGVAVRAIQTTNNANAIQQTNDDQAISQALDANLPKVLTALNEHKMALVDAMGAFGTLSKLSLFKYI
jgi:flagellar hook-associated protein 3 FlgL